MTYFFLILGLFFIGVGFAVKALPDLIAGYNTLSKEQKKNVDIAGLSTHMRNSLVVMGLLIIIGYYLLVWFGLHKIVGVFLQIIIWGGFAYIFVRARKYNVRKKQ